MSNTKEKIEYGYKVVSVLPGRQGMTGAWVRESDVEWRDPGSVFYSTVSWTYPRSHCGPLAVFDTLYHAQEFAMPACSRRIYRCKFVRSKGEVLYRREWGGKEERHLLTCPRGTILARKVKLMKRAV